MPIRIMLAGRRRRGKDTMANYIQRLRPQVRRVAFADGVRAEAISLLEWWEWAKPDQPYVDWLEQLQQELQENKILYGPLLQFVGEYGRQKFGPEFWISELHDRYGHLGDLVITDCRYPNEVEYGHTHGFTVVRINGPCRGDDGRSDTHPSEAQVDSLDVDLNFNNVGTLEDMERWVRERLLPYVEV